MKERTMDIKVIDNALPQEMFDSLVEEMTNWGKCPWFFTPNSAYDGSEKRTNELKEYSWAHTPIKEGIDNSYLAGQMRNICSKLEETYLSEETLYGIRRVRFGMHTAFETPFINEPHIDFSKGTQVGLLYLNDSDGDTVFWDRYYEGGVIVENDQLLSAWDRVKKDAKIVKTVTPKANRIVFFDGTQYHASSVPTKSLYRIIMNINWYVRDPIHELVLQ